MTVWTIYRNLSFISNERVVTRWAIGRWIYYSFISCSLTDDATHNIRNYLTSTLYKDHIPDSHIFQCNFIIVMQCCSRDSYSTKINWFQQCHWRHNTRSSDTMFDRKYSRARFCRWEFICYRITWMMCCMSELFPEREIINLQYESINFKIKCFLESHKIIDLRYK